MTYPGRLYLWMGLLVLALLASAPVHALQPFQAEYRLLFNDELVGRALFRLKLDDQGNYSFEAYTVPDGKQAADHNGHEVLEVSEGRLENAVPVPANYFYSVHDPAGTRLLEEVFDWQAKALRRRSDEASVSAALAPGTQDRLSYLLRLAQAVAQDDSEFEFALAEPEATAQLKFRRHGHERLKLPAGETEATGVACFTGEDTPDRVIWIAPAWDHIPVLIERALPEGRVRMELVQRQGGPLPH